MFRKLFRHRHLLLCVTILLNNSHIPVCQPRAQPDIVYVDGKGVMRWKKTKTEVQGFGINYTVPFAHAYRAGKSLGVSHREAIDNDVYHFARLGFDAYRVHVWDTEISDSTGNLLENEHLELFDYMLKKMKERGMKFILTPIAFWGNGYPEPDEKTPGFSRKYGKESCLVNEDAIKAQETYLSQFLNHINPHTGIAYKDDPDIIAFEISNEPHHKESADKVTNYIHRMVNAMRNTDCKKPIFYNVSHSIHLVNAYYDAGIQGGTFQWYPTGLGAQEELGGNLLPNVDRYTVAFADNAKFKSGAKIVYEFDAADVGRSYIYPAMARSFRQAGIQWAAHFSYDPTFMAFANTEYNTHYMNLVYTPQKALSLKLASEVFHTIPMYKDYGSYPENKKFGPFTVNYEEDLAEMNTETKFIYTNATTTRPILSNRLEEIAGYSNSSVVNYEGLGAYFLDKIEPGVWRLEVLPDALWIEDPFGRNSLQRNVAAVIWRRWPMKINLTDLGEDFSVVAVNDNNTFSTKVIGQSFNIAPGTYLLARKGTTMPISPGERWKNIVINEYFAPKSNLKATHVLHKPVFETTAGLPIIIETTVVSLEEPMSVELSTLSGYRPRVYSMKKVQGYQYSVTIPADEMKPGFLRYVVTVKDDNDKELTFPGAITGSPSAWDFRAQRPYEVRVIPSGSPLYIFDALSDNDELSRTWNRESSFAPMPDPAKAEIRIDVEKLFAPDPENPKAEKIQDYSMRYFFGRKIEGRREDLASKKRIVFRGRSLSTKSSWIQIALVTKAGEAYGGVIKIETVSQDYELLLSDLKRVKLVTLPRPYPTFLPYFFEARNTVKMDVSDIETLQISLGPGIPESEIGARHAFAIESVRLE